MFFHSYIEGAVTPLKFNVDFYDNGSTKVIMSVTSEDTNTIPEIVELSTRSIVQKSYDYTKFVSDRDLKDLGIKCIKEIHKGSNIDGTNPYYVYAIDLSKVEVVTSGKFLDTLLKEKSLVKSNFHECIKCSQITVHRIINKNDNITIPMALKLGKVLSTDPKVFLELQANYDLIQTLQKKDFTKVLYEIQVK